MRSVGAKFHRLRRTKYVLTMSAIIKGGRMIRQREGHNVISPRHCPTAVSDRDES